MSFADHREGSTIRASSGAYFQRLDHVRAAAIFLVFCWHYVHLSVSWDVVPSFFLFSIVEEGHTGVALFMVLSGYLFARLTEGRKILFLPFLYNRFLRLAPMLSILMIGALSLTTFTIGDLFTGLILPYKWPGGAWSIACEIQFYMLFPLLLVLSRRLGDKAFIGCFVAMLVLRIVLINYGFDAKTVAYSTLAGRLDQFVAGMLFCRLSKLQIFKTHSIAILAGTILVFGAIWHAFNHAGGFGKLEPQTLWAGVPLIEAIAFGLIIAAYEHFPYEMPQSLSRAIAHVGCVSYSLYLIHIFMIETFIAAYAPRADTLAQGTLYAVIAFPFFVGLSTLTYRCIELPFLKFRCRYLAEPVAEAQPTKAASSSPSTSH